MPPSSRFSKLLLHRECCSIRSFHEGGCSVVFPNRQGPWHCVSGSRYQRNHGYSDKLCDLMLAWNRPDHGLVASSLELKGGGIDVDNVVTQLQHGADILDDFLEGQQCDFMPVLIHRSLRTVEVRELEGKVINFRRHALPIILRRGRATITDLPWDPYRI